MRVYIAYKYRAVEDKDGLKRELELISSAIEQLEHKPFVLGRDVQKWHTSSGSVFKTIPHILANIIKSDTVFAYVNNDAKSWGLPFELFWAKLLGKPVILAKKVGVEFKNDTLKPIKTLEFTNIDNLLAQIASLNI
jgi:hypothetical protein